MQLRASVTFTSQSLGFTQAFEKDSTGVRTQGFISWDLSMLELSHLACLGQTRGVGEGELPPRLELHLALGPNHTGVCGPCLPSPCSWGRHCYRQTPLMPGRPTSHISKSQRVTLLKVNNNGRGIYPFYPSTHTGLEKSAICFPCKHWLIWLKK